MSSDATENKVYKILFSKRKTMWYDRLDPAIQPLNVKASEFIMNFSWYDSFNALKMLKLYYDSFKALKVFHSVALATWR